MSSREIDGLLSVSYGTEVLPDFISPVAGADMAETTAGSVVRLKSSSRLLWLGCGQNMQ